MRKEKNSLILGTYFGPGSLHNDLITAPAEHWQGRLLSLRRVGQDPVTE